MDTVTQIVLGSAIAEAGFRKKLGAKAVVFGGVCGLLPDLDIITRLQGTWQYLQHHRGISHSIFFLTLLTPIMGYLGYRYLGKKTYFLTWLWLAFLALVTHPILDLFTSYGTQLLFPLTSQKLAIDAISIMDPIYTLLLFCSLFIGCLKIFSYDFRRNFAIAMLFLSTSYIGFGYLQSQKAISLAQRQLLSENRSIAKIRVTPSLFNIFVWRIIAQDNQENFQIGIVSTLNPRPIVFCSVIKEKHPLVIEALDTEKGKIFQNFSMGLLSARVESNSEGYRVYLLDMRYGLVNDPSQNVFGAVFDFDKNGSFRDASRLARPYIRIQDELKAIWESL